MKKLIVLVSLLLSLPSLAQHEVGLKGNGGICYLSTRFKDPIGFRQNFSIQPSLQGGLFYAFHFNNSFHLGAELLWLSIEGKEKMTVTNTDANGIPNGNYTTVNFYREISYIGLPLYVGYKRNKWSFNLGIQCNYHLYSSASENGYGVDQNGQAFEWNHDGGELNIDVFNFGVRPGIVYSLNDLFSLEANYYGGINNILNSQSLNDDWKWRVHQLTIGLRFHILTSIRD